MTRLLAVMLALKLAAPHWQPRRETAVLLVELERRYEVPAELVIADAEYESRWHERVVNPSSGTVGLMQVRPRDAEHAARLAEWRTNLREGVAIFVAARESCRAKGRGRDARLWLWLPTGWQAVTRSQCGYRDGKRLPTPKGIAWILRRAKQLGG